MALQDPTRVYDGWNSLPGGVDSGRDPDLIGKDQAWEATDVVFRGGDPTSRPGFNSLSNNYLNNLEYRPDGFYDFSTNVPGYTNTDNAFRRGKFQGASYFSPPTYDESIIAMIGGRFFQLTPNENSIDIREHYIENQINNRSWRGEFGLSTIPIKKLTTRNTINNDLAYMVQADRFHITQDGSSLPIIFDGVTARRAENDEVPVGTIMAYGMGRLVVCQFNNIFFGDLFGSHAEDSSDPGKSVLKFTETTYLNEGGPAAITSSLGKISAAFFTPQQDTSTGDGELLVSSERGITSFFLSQPREVWKESAFQRIALQNTGVLGHRNYVSKNGDVWFRAEDGMRSYRQARAEIQGWAHLPMSTNIQHWTGSDTTRLLKYGSSASFDGRILFTGTPITNQGRLYHDSIFSLDFDVLSSFGQALRPAWDGRFSGLKTTQLVSGIFKGRERCFAFGLDSAGDNHVYEISTAARQDYSGPITSELVMRSMTFEDGGGPSPFNEKKLLQADVWVDDVIEDEVTLSLAYRPDNHPDFVAWRTIGPILPVGTRQATDRAGVPTIKKSFAPRKTVGKPPRACDDIYTNRRLDRGYEFQSRLRWTGHAKIRRFRLHGQTIIEDPKANC